jgi:hypothetical protein
VSLRQDFQAAADDYARRLDANAERERLAALAAEARHAATTDDAAAALGEMFAALDDQNNPDDPLGDTAEDTTPTDNQEN